MTQIAINTAYITLGQFLKFSGILDSGSMVKQQIAYMDITVNGEKENRRGKKLYPNDIVVVDGKKFEIVCEDQ